ncbi:CMRF35-like molecule 3 isoform X1 [Dicentrarchus labrax]|uniref:Immunoglobulin domain-containing protein n=1 Tax=Dicentrarchus labrax TaxID=13489 RepID=A0A8C4EQK2_DICLA|nr:CMRF35-like molecule 3 isoform X1 [Dicentrarchus labrax]
MSRILLGFFYAPALCLLWLTNHAVDSVQLSAPEVVTAAYGGSVTVPCQYDHQFRENTKYWCKGKIYRLCRIVVKTPKNRPSNRSFITDDKEAGVFTVTMTSLRKSDEDMYWCVIARSGTNIYAGVRLCVSHTGILQLVITTTTTTPTSSSPMAQEEIIWWTVLRWILFILILCCLVSTHIVVWRIKTARKIWPHLQFKRQSSNIYD